VSARRVSRIDISARERLLQLARREGRDFNLVLNRYYQERFLARLAASPYRDRFLLKGALFLLARAGDERRQLARPTRDVDLGGEAIGNAPDRLRDLFGEVCALPLRDGVAFDTAGIATERIVEDADYPGVRLTIPVAFAGARGHLQVDVGFGDVVTPGPQELTFPTLLNGMPAPTLLAYSVETVVAEKFEAMIKLSLVNSRMKDCYDLCQLARTESFAGAVLQEAVRKTFARRGTRFLPDPAIFRDTFGSDSSRQQQWATFLRRSRLTAAPEGFADVIAVLRDFLEPLHIASQESQPFSQRWSPDDLRWA
jgi:predicted nucleotidyltransferase component of viral defense system